MSELRVSSISRARKNQSKTKSVPCWATNLTTQWKSKKSLKGQEESKILQQAITLLSRYRPSSLAAFSVPEQPFDSHLLFLSRLYRNNRRLFFKTKGKFIPSFISSPRTLSSPGLLSETIEYSPLEQEILWAAHNPIQKNHPHYLLTLRSCTTSLYHEQSHRILWKFLPGIHHPSKSLLRKYLNFIESLVVTLDMALGDELGTDLASLFYLCGVTYDPGTSIKNKEISSARVNQAPNKRSYRNYLHAATYGVYLNLEHYELRDIPKIVLSLFPQSKELTERAVKRSLLLDREFVLNTNPFWQQRHFDQAKKFLFCKKENSIEFNNNPLDNRLHYLWTEKWLEHMGL